MFENTIAIEKHKMTMTPYLWTRVTIMMEKNDYSGKEMGTITNQSSPAHQATSLPFLCHKNILGDTPFPPVEISKTVIKATDGQEKVS